MRFFKRKPPAVPLKNRLVIVLYHFVSDAENEFTRAGHTLGTAEFRRQLEYLAAHFSIVRLHEVAGLLREEPARRPPYAAVCFDDGYRCVLEEAYPILEELRLPATMFISPSVIGNRDLLWRDKIRCLIERGWEQECISFLRGQGGRYDFSCLEEMGFYIWSKKPKAVRSMAIQKDVDRFLTEKDFPSAALAAENRLFLDDADVRPYEFLDFGNHTWSHPVMTLLSREAQREEIMKCHRYLREKGMTSRGLALPFSPYDRNTLAVCREADYRYVLTVFEFLNDLSQQARAKPMILHRRMAPPTMRQFVAMVEATKPGYDYLDA